MEAKDVEVAMSVTLMDWFRRQYPDEDIEVTRLRELGEDADGVLLTIGDTEFRVEVT